MSATGVEQSTGADFAALTAKLSTTHGSKSDGYVRHTCPVDKEFLLLERYNGKAVPPFPKDWYLYVVHDHDVDPPVWTAVTFYRKHGGRYPAAAKTVIEKQAENKREVVRRQQVKNASRPKRGGTGG